MNEKHPNQNQTPSQKNVSNMKSFDKKKIYYIQKYNMSQMNLDLPTRRMEIGESTQKSTHSYQQQNNETQREKNKSTQSI